MKLKLLILVILLIGFIKVNAQSYTYSYIDPCNGNTKYLSVPINGSVSISYYGSIQNFTYDEIINGGLERWASSVYSQFGNNNPCASIVGVPTAVSIAQNTTINFLGVVNSLSSLADMATSTSSMLGGSVGSVQISSGGSGNNNSKDNNKGSNGSNNSNNDPGNSNENSSNTNNTGSNNNQGSQTNPQNGQGQGSNGSGSSGNNGENKEQQNTPESESGGKTNLVGGSVNSIGSSSGEGGSSNNNSGGNKSSSASSRNGNRPSILASSDFVGFNFKNTDVDYGGKVTGGITSLRWDGKRSWGLNADYTSAIRGPNITGFYAFMNPKRIDLISVSATIGFEAKPTLYSTLALGQMWTIKKNLKAVYMLTASSGQVYGEPFIGTAVIGGGMYDFNVSKRISMKTMLLYVYAPYISYYNDILLKSPHVVLPIIGTNISVTKRFKLNINAGGAWAIKDAALNYTVMMGTRMLL